MKERTVYALGFFDGVHLGHQALLAACRGLATEYGCKAGVVTFSQHPDTLVSGNTPKLINTVADRKRLLAAMGAESIVTLPFDKKLMEMPWQEFIAFLRVDHGAAGFVCGNDFHFGFKGEGTAEKLQNFCKEQGIPCAVVPEQTLDGVRVSSTHIRSLLDAGDIETANRFLGHAHTLTGQVVSGRRIGRTIGIPTANINLPEGVVVPKLGVYACLACFDGHKYPAVTNIGNRPTVGGHHITVEPWILDFEGDLYGKEITLAFFRFLRPERKFDSLAELKAEIQKNAAQTRDFFEKT